MDRDLHLVLKSLDCVMFRYRYQGQFESVFVDTPWLKQLLPFNHSAKYFPLYGHSLFLDDFIKEAERFWLSHNETLLESGIWTEQLNDNELMHFEAEAIIADDMCYLIIKNLERKFADRQKTLQLAREMILAHEDLVSRHNYTQERVQHLLSQSDDLQAVLSIISTAVDSVNTGIIITDAQMQPQIDNPAIYSLFNVDKTNNEQKTLSLLLKLLDKQYPELERILSAEQTWQGEICWMQPPFTMKWFMLSVIPVKNNKLKLQHWLFLVSDISRVKHLQQQNEKLTLIDHLTELPNRQYFWNAIDNLIAQQTPFFTLYIDIKNFKAINEEFGHTTGDEVLILIAEQIQQVLKKVDVVARIGGDEFAIVLPNITNVSYCKKIIERINKLILTPYLHRKINNLNISLNIGAAQYPQDGDSVERIMKSADIAVHQAKTLKGVNYAFYSKALEEESIKTLKLKKELGNAFEQNQFELYFQPIYDTTYQQVAKVEVLLRWHHPELGLVMPASFIPLAEETGLIIPLGKWVFEQACVALEKLKFRGHNIDMAINLSPRQFNDATLAEFIEATIKNFNVSACNLELEVTEGLLINNFDAVLEQLEGLRKVGIGLSVDDFGTGYSSLSYLKRLPINTLKIDRSFVMDLAEDANDKAIVSAVIAMAHKLNLRVVAEGVEQENQLNYLKENFCDFIQGFLLSEPTTFSQLCDILDAKK